jgi:hypothetical protein
MNEPVGNLFEPGAPRPLDLAQVDDERDVQQHREREHGGKEAIDPVRRAASNRKRKPWARLWRRWAQQLEQHGRAADGDLAARRIGQRDWPGRIARGARGDVRDRRAVGDTGGHVVPEAKEAAAAALLEQAPAVRQVVPRHDERAVRRSSDRDVAGPREQAFFDDPTAVNDADAQQAALAAPR